MSATADTGQAEIGSHPGPSEYPEEDTIQIHTADDDCADIGSGLEDDYDDEDDDFHHGTIHVWDEDSDDDEQSEEQRPRQRRKNIFRLPARDGRGPRLPPVTHWWRTLLIGSAEPGRLSIGHVAVNLFSSSLHPGVLLAMPVYFARAGEVPGMIILVLIALLSGFGGGLWVILGRYVGGNTIEAIVSRAFGMNTRWKKNLGHGIGSVLLVIYCTGAAVIAYHAMTDLLLQVSFYYTATGQLFHDRAFVTLAVGGALTLPLLLSTTPKRNIIQIQSWIVLLFYPAVIGIMFARLNDLTIPSLRRGSPMSKDVSLTTFVPMPQENMYAWPWASTAMIQLLTLSTSPAQILAHNRSLRRKHAYDSNVISFHIAQFVQVLMVVAVVYFMSVEIGMFGTEELQGGLHPNFFTAFPLDDNYVNVARILFAILLAAHVSVCLASARSCWSRFLNLMNLHPLRSIAPPTPHLYRRPTFQRQLSRSFTQSSPLWLPSSWRSPSQPFLSEQDTAELRTWRRFKFLRSTLGGVMLWTITATTAYVAGVGGLFRREEKEGEELRFLRSIEVMGVFGAFVGFILPAIIWLILFRIRRPRAILLLQTNAMRRRINQYLRSPLSTLSGMSHPPTEETEPLLSEPHADSDDATSPAREVHISMPNHLNEHTAADCDDATLILLARKERELQRKSRGYVVFHASVTYRRRRRMQELVVVAALLPCGFLLVVMALFDLTKGEY